MKRGFSILLTLLTCLALLAACGKRNGGEPAQLPEEADAPAAKNVTLSDFCGCWEDGAHASLTVAPNEERGDVEVVIHRSVSARETNEWIMHGTFDAANASVSYADGEKNRITRRGAAESAESLRRNGSGTLTLLEDGTLRWTDDGETDSASRDFVRVAPELPTAQDLADGYFRVVGGCGTPDEQARSACEVLRFAYTGDMLSQNRAELRAMLRFAWEGMSGEEQSAFASNFTAVARLIDGAASDDESVRAAFDAAGVGGEMADFAASAYCRACWASLRDDTVHMDE